MSRKCVWTITLLLLGLIIWGYCRLHMHTGDVRQLLNNIDIKESCPVTGKDPQSLNNSQMVLNFNASRLTIISILIAIAGVILTYAAFYIQYLFNERQKRDISSERFENQYFHFLDVYRDICNTISVPNAGTGKIAFHYMFYEYKAIYNIILERGIITDPTDYQRMNQLAFSIFINGVSYDFPPSSSDQRITKDQLTELSEALLRLQEQSGLDAQDPGVKYIRDYKGRHIKYFDGHRLRLIHYFKYIFIIIDHVIRLEDKTEAEKFDVLKYLPSEMSEHEIGLLYAYTHYVNLDEKYGPYLNKIFNELPVEQAYKFKFDNDSFIFQNA